ncbi:MULTISPECIES: DJ-1/PfpI family protein [Bartonella]|uniref:DJ-1/PfpI family protein n=1 Tax=Bartonella TaxID=773 RepID=UPI0018DE315E|nr:MULTISPECIES: DJ-1/PfpI family protein [Bartonella]MBI0170288.1 DJ-1/PfpI family protein [Bartonella sp. W8167]MBI0175734.1 DJ-1/PfpI family protein [Bartonella apis]
MTVKAGFFIFDEMQLLDFAAPYDAFSSTPDMEVSLIGESLKPITTMGGLSFSPDHDISTLLPLDVLCIPGGNGVNRFLNNEPVLDFIRKEANEVRFLTSICTGSLILGATGLLKGRKATTHWSAMEFLPLFGAIPVEERVVVDGHIITAGGITAGMDFGLVIIAKLLGEDTAKKTQLLMQYDPEPPFDCGTPEKAPKALVEQLQQENSTDERRKLIREWQAKQKS